MPYVGGKFGERYFTECLLNNKPVKIIPVELDKWGRMVATVFSADGHDIALEMLKAGMAWHYSAYDNTRAYIEAERQARYTRTGLWARPNPLNPQQYRSSPRSIKQKHQ